MLKTSLVIVMSLFVVHAVSADEMPRVISVTGQGNSSAPPDMATVQTGVLTQAATAQEALASNNNSMEKILSVLKKKGMADKDLQTSGFSVSPEYAQPVPGQRVRSNRPEIVGYRVSNNLTVKVRNLSRLGEILDALVQAGSNQVSGVSFGIADLSAISNAARLKAMDDARGRANLYANAAEVKLGKVISVSEQPVQLPRPMFESRMAMADMGGGSVPIATGEQEVSASIHVVYAIVE